MDGIKGLTHIIGTGTLWLMSTWDSIAVGVLLFLQAVYWAWKLLDKWKAR